MVRVKMFKGQHSIAGRRLTAPAGTRIAEVRS